MKYSSLSEIYYADKSKYESTYKERFASDECIKLDFYIGENQVFFLETHSLLKEVNGILWKTATIRRIADALPKVAWTQLRNKYLIDEIVLTNDIEGVQSTRREIGEVLTDLSGQNTRSRFAGLVNKYVNLGDVRQIKTCEDIRNLYDDMFLDEVIAEDKKNRPDGKMFRAGCVSVINGAQKTLHEGLFPESKIIDAMNSALVILNDPEIELIFRIGIFHYLFGYIHPFYEGNGRMSRYISSNFIAEGLTPLLGYRISYTVKENLKGYYKAFNVCNDVKNKGDITPFLLMFTRLISLSCDSLEADLLRKSNDYETWKKLLPQISGEQPVKMQELYGYLTQASLFSDIGISIPELLVLTDVTRATLAKRLNKIDSTGILKLTKRGKGKFYMLDLDKIELDDLISEQ